MNAVETTQLGRRFGSKWVLRGLDLALPQHSVVGVVGANGAGKTTLLHLMTGLIEPTEGSIQVLGGRPGTVATLPDVAFVAQDAPLPMRWRIRDVVTIAEAMNVRWDSHIAGERIDALELAPGQRVGDLSGGQRAQLALALALAKRPQLLVLDEPVASLDPMARRAFLRSMMAAVADGHLTVVFSTHLLDDLERTCDHLVLLGRGSLLLDGPIEDIMAHHAILVGPDDRSLPRGVRPVAFGSDEGHQRLVRLERPLLDPSWDVVAASLDEIVLAHLDHRAATAVPQPEAC